MRTSLRPGAPTGELRPVRDGLLDDLKDLVAQELVAVQERGDQRRVDVAVLREHREDALALRLEDVLDLLLGLGVPRILPTRFERENGPSVTAS
jgi:hypothetical protein